MELKLTYAHNYILLYAISNYLPRLICKTSKSFIIFGANIVHIVKPLLQESVLNSEI